MVLSWVSKDSELGAQSRGHWDLLWSFGCFAWPCGSRPLQVGGCFEVVGDALEPQSPLSCSLLNST